MPSCLFPEMMGGRGAGLCPGAPRQIGPSSWLTEPQVVLQEAVIYTAQSDTCSLHLPTIRQSPVVTNGPTPMAWLLLGTLLSAAAPRAHPSFPAAQVGADKSSSLQSQLQGHHSERREDCLEFLNFIFYRNNWQHAATDPLTPAEAWLPIHQHSPPARKRATSPGSLRGSVSSPQGGSMDTGVGGWPHSLSPPSLSQSCPKALLLLCLWEYS